jgi:hypothetical protein
MMNAAENPKGKNKWQEMFSFKKTELLYKLDKEMSIVVIRHKFGLNKFIIFMSRKMERR